jgi:hypothetical protein
LTARRIRSREVGNGPRRRVAEKATSAKNAVQKAAESVREAVEEPIDRVEDVGTRRQEGTGEEAAAKKQAPSA